MDVLTRYRAYITIWEVKNVTNMTIIFSLCGNGRNKQYYCYLKRDTV